MKAGDSIRIVRARPADEHIFCNHDSWYIQPYVHETNEQGIYPGPTYYLYKDYEGAVGVILESKRNTIHRFDFYVVLIGNEKIMCLECVMEKVGD